MGRTRELWGRVGAIGHRAWRVGKTSRRRLLFSRQNVGYSPQKYREAEFIDSKGVLADLAEPVASTDTPIDISGPNPGDSLSKANAPGVDHPSTPAQALSSFRPGRHPERPMNIGAARFVGNRATALSRTHFCKTSIKTGFCRILAESRFSCEEKAGTVEVDIGHVQPHRTALCNVPRFVQVGPRTVGVA